MKRYILNCRKIRTKEELFSEVKKVLPVPEYFGSNLDALRDFLSGQKMTLEIRKFSCLRSSLGGYADSLEEMLRATDGESSNFSAVIKE